MVSWLYLNELKNDDLYFSSKGHDAPGLYAVLIALGRLPFEKLHGLRRLGGLPGHPDVGVPGMVTNTGSLGMGISKAKGMVLADRLKGHKRRYLRADRRRRAAGGADLGVADLCRQCRHGRDHGHRRPQQAAVRLSGEPDERSRRPRGQVRELRLACRALRRPRPRCASRRRSTSCAAHPGRPQVIIADTVKGRGVSFMEHTAMDSDTDMYRFHSRRAGPTAIPRARRSCSTASTARCRPHRRGAARAWRRSSRRPRRRPAATKRLIPAYTEALLAARRQGRAHRRARLRPRARHRADPVQGEVPRPLRRMRHRREGHGLAGGRHGAQGTRAHLPFLRLLPVDPAQRADLQQRDRAHEGRLCRLARRADPGGARPHPSILARHLGARLGAEPRYRRAVLPRGSAAAARLHLGTKGRSGYLRLISVPWPVPFAYPAKRLEAGRGVVLWEGKDAPAVASSPMG